jgi:hypothetical protein
MDRAPDPRPSVDASSLQSVCEYAVRHLVPPADVREIAAGGKTSEPFLIRRDRIPLSGQDKRRFLAILAELYGGNNARFDEAAPTVRGTRRKYFGRTEEEVLLTGSSNFAERIPNSPWHVSVNNSGPRKREIVERLMTKMKFSSEYTEMVASLCIWREPQLPRRYKHELARAIKIPEAKTTDGPKPEEAPKTVAAAVGVEYTGLKGFLLRLFRAIHRIVQKLLKR